MAKRDWVWMARSEHRLDRELVNAYPLRRPKPSAESPRELQGGAWETQAATICASVLRRLGADIKPGEVKKVRVKLEVIE